jgi:hypothetical protein
MKKLGMILCFGAGGILWFFTGFFAWLEFKFLGGIPLFVIPVPYSIFPIVYLVKVGFNGSFIGFMVLYLITFIGIFLIAKADNGNKSTVNG